MTRKQIWIAFFATMLLVSALAVYAWLEPQRMASAADAQRAEAVSGGVILYAENCVVCHGAAGEGIGASPPLNAEGLQTMGYETLYKAIERGRYGTAMAPWGAAEGGVLAPAEIDQLIAVMLYASWDDVSRRVAQMGLVPPEVIAAEISDETLQLVAELPAGEALARALPVYSANCLACHGANGEGTDLGPPLNSDELRTRLSANDIGRIISSGVPGTLMAGWESALPAETIADLSILIQQWETLDLAGISLPQAPLAEIPMTAEAISLGEQLYGVACANCHGSDGQGTRMAPALNVKGYLSATNDLALQQIIAMGVPGTSMPAWGDRLSGPEIDALVAYLRSWEPTAPEVAVPSQGRGGGGQGGPPWMREGSGSDEPGPGDEQKQVPGPPAGRGGNSGGRGQPAASAVPPEAISQERIWGMLTDWLS